ncbi:uncharacterized protein [Triticum aestivum]|uniref:uncharacterized protein n=1 Tax=Triticum aestivum TaxID=4565 RepID=UPI001D00FF00|nr:uncharacterized protein LOC123152232 [Triticum aestivum]
MHLLQPLARSLHHIHWVSTKNGRLQMLSSTFSLPPEDGRRQRARRCRHLTATASLSRCRAFQIQDSAETTSILASLMCWVLVEAMALHTFVLNRPSRQGLQDFSETSLLTTKKAELSY